MDDGAALLAATDRADVLRARSGLPGPRANLPLARAYAEVAPLDEAMDFARSDDEYLALCGATALGRRGEPAARVAARDPRWRVREGVATGLQLLAAADPAAMLALLEAWRDDPDLLVQRARVAAISEPPLLKKDRALAVAALEICREATEALRAAADRRSEPARVLRQALGYCWSVAVAADPAAGLPRFAALEADPDPDVQWIARTNRGKARLRRLR